MYAWQYLCRPEVLPLRRGYGFWQDRRSLFCKNIQISRQQAAFESNLAGGPVSVFRILRKLKGSLTAFDGRSIRALMIRVITGRTIQWVLKLLPVNGWRSTRKRLNENHATTSGTIWIKQLLPGGSGMWN